MNNQAHKGEINKRTVSRDLSGQSVVLSEARSPGTQAQTCLAQMDLQMKVSWRVISKLGG